MQLSQNPLPFEEYMFHLKLKDKNLKTIIIESYRDENLRSLFRLVQQNPQVEEIRIPKGSGTELIEVAKFLLKAKNIKTLSWVESKEPTKTDSSRIKEFTNKLGDIVQENIPNLKVLNFGFVDLHAIRFWEALAFNVHINALTLTLGVKGLEGTPALLAIKHNTSLLSITGEHPWHHPHLRRVAERNKEALSVNRAYIFRTWLLKHRCCPLFDPNAFKLVSRFLPELRTKRFDLLSRTLTQNPMTQNPMTQNPGHKRKSSEIDRKSGVDRKSRDQPLQKFGILEKNQQKLAILEKNQEKMLSDIASLQNQQRVIFELLAHFVNPPPKFHEEIRANLDRNQSR